MRAAEVEADTGTSTITPDDLATLARAADAVADQEFRRALELRRSGDEDEALRHAMLALQWDGAADRLRTRSLF